jgi:multidrug resistance efflux pump
VRESAAEFELAVERVRKREIRAPFAGFVVDLFDIRPGEGCRENETPLVRLVDTRRCHLVCNLEARAGHMLAVGQSVKLEIESGTSVLPVEGRVDFVSPVVDPASGLLKMKVLFENREGKIRPGVAGVMILGD